MDIPTLVLKVFSVYLIIGGLFLIFKGKTIPLILKDFFDHPAAVYFSGILLVFLSSMYLIQYNIWDGTWLTLVTVFVWLVFIKGLLYIFAPKSLSEMSLKKYRSLFAVYGVVAIIVGIYFFFLV